LAVFQTLVEPMPHLAALVTGLLLFASDHPLRLWWLQFVAFVPFWWAIGARGRKPALPLGALLGLGYALPTMVTAGSSPPVLVAALANVAQWSLLAVLTARVHGCRPVLGPLAAAAAVTLVEVAVWHLVPMFGTAQCFVRPLSAAPAWCAFTAWTGVAGLVFVLTATQALGVAALRREHRCGALGVAAALLAAVVVGDWLRWTRPLGPQLTVATVGWHGGWDRFDSAFDQLAAEAKQRGAVLLVTPETGIATGHIPRERTLGWLSGIAKANALTLAAGVWHGSTKDNRIWFLGPDGTLRGEYRKTHLIPWLENYVAGDGTLFFGDVGGGSLGGMICQDDNFTDLARSYGRTGTRVVAVPTNDWPEIRAFHLANSVFRAIENGYAIVRAASRGSSALVTARGEIVQQMDHVEQGPGLLVGAVATGDGEPTWYARFGDLPMVVLCVLLLGLASLRRRE
jgi:apolipoprotein N-acyltransferase